MISPNLSETGPPPRIPPFYKGPPSPDDKTDRVAAMNKITNFSIAAIMNSRGRKSEDDDDFEAKRRKLAEAVPALGKEFFYYKNCQISNFLTVCLQRDYLILWPIIDP